jgi:hypothetical protein
MPYIGNKGSIAGFVNQPSKQDLTGATGGTLTLTHAVSGPEDISLFINNVRQEPTESYTATGTTVTLQGYTVAATDDIYVLYNGLTQLNSVPTDGSVSTAKIANNAVSMAKLATSGTLPALDGSALTGIFSTENATFTNQTATTTSSTFQTSNISDSITPSSTSSKILGLFSFTLSFDAYSNSGVDGQYRIMRGTTEVTRRRLNSWTDTGAIPVTIAFLDSPSTTSAVTYTLEYRRVSAYAGNPNVGLGGNSTDLDDEVILLEIKG